MISRDVRFGPAASGAAGVVSEEALGAGSVTTTKLADGAVTAAKLDPALYASIIAAAVACSATVMQGSPSTTTTTNQTTGLALSTTPARTGMYVTLNGLEYELGDGVKTKDFYFSGDGGTTARALAAIVSGDVLYWTKYREVFDLATSDILRVHYTAAYTAFASASLFFTAGAGLTGGGDLSANRTFAIAAADGTMQINADSIEATGVFAAKAVTTTAYIGLGASELLPTLGRIRSQRNSYVLTWKDNVGGDRGLIQLTSGDDIALGDTASVLYLLGSAIDAGGSVIRALAEPTAAQHAATKNYVDTGALEILRFGDAGAIAAGQVNYLHWGDDGVNSTEAKVSVEIVHPGTYKHLRVKLYAAPGSGKSVTYTFMINGAPSAELTVTISDTATTGHVDSALGEALVLGDLISVKQDASAGSTASEPKIVVY